MEADINVVDGQVDGRVIAESASIPATIDLGFEEQFDGLYARAYGVAFQLLPQLDRHYRGIEWDLGGVQIQFVAMQLCEAQLGLVEQLLKGLAGEKAQMCGVQQADLAVIVMP